MSTYQPNKGIINQSEIIEKILPEFKDHNFQYKVLELVAEGYTEILDEALSNLFNDLLSQVSLILKEGYVLNLTDLGQLSIKVRKASTFSKGESPSREVVTGDFKLNNEVKYLLNAQL